MLRTRPAPPGEPPPLEAPRNPILQDAIAGDRADTIDSAALALTFRAAMALRAAPRGPFEPPPVLELGETARRARARAAGEALLADGAVAALVVAGGQATRLGATGPKGLYPIGPVTGRSLFALYARKLAGLERHFGRRIPWIVMTSQATDRATRAAFARERDFGLEVSFVRQRQLPCVDFEGRPLRDEAGNVLTAPDGHGGMLWALAHAGVLAALGQRGIRALAYHQVDNPLARWADPLLLGLLETESAEIASKIVRKQSPSEGVGNAVVGPDGRTRILEYTELDPVQAAARDAAGGLRLWAGAIGVHAFRLDFLARLAPRADAVLPAHPSPKRIPCRGAVAPSEPNGYKLERFVFDLLPEARALVMVEAQRDDEYAPVKSAADVESARHALDACARRWLAGAGVALPGPGSAVELDPLWIDGPEHAAAALPPGAWVTGPSIDTRSGGCA